MLINFHRRYRGGLNEVKKSDITSSAKNAKLDAVITRIFASDEVAVTVILKATINCLTGHEDANKALNLDILANIEYLTANATTKGLFGIGCKDVTVGATHILFAAAVKLNSYQQKNENNDQLVKMTSSKEKASCVSNMITHLQTNNADFPDLPRDRDGIIKFSKIAYFNDCNMTANNQLRINGHGYTDKTYGFDMEDNAENEPEIKDALVKQQQLQIGDYLAVKAKHADDSGNLIVALTPKHTASNFALVRQHLRQVAAPLKQEEEKSAGLQSIVPPITHLIQPPPQSQPEIEIIQAQIIPQKVSSPSYNVLPQANEQLKLFITDFNLGVKDTLGLVSMFRATCQPDEFTTDFVEQDTQTRQQNFMDNKRDLVNFSGTVITPNVERKPGSDGHNKLFIPSNGFIFANKSVPMRTLEFGFLFTIEKINIQNSMPESLGTGNMNFSGARQDHRGVQGDIISLKDGTKALRTPSGEILYPGRQAARKVDTKNPLKKRTTVSIGGVHLEWREVSGLRDKSVLPADKRDKYATHDEAKYIYGRNDDGEIQSFAIYELKNNQDKLLRTAKYVNKYNEFTRHFVPETLFLPTGKYMDAVKAIFIVAMPNVTSYNSFNKVTFAQPRDVKEYLLSLNGTENMQPIIKVAQEQNKPILVMYRNSENKDTLMEFNC